MKEPLSLYPSPIQASSSPNQISPLLFPNFAAPTHVRVSLTHVTASTRIPMLVSLTDLSKVYVLLFFTTFHSTHLFAGFKTLLSTSFLCIFLRFFLCFNAPYMCSDDTFPALGPDTQYVDFSSWKIFSVIRNGMVHPLWCHVGEGSA